MHLDRFTFKNSVTFLPGNLIFATCTWPDVHYKIHVSLNIIDVQTRVA